MRQMKDSGIEWIGKVPENWGIERGKNIMSKLERPVLEEDGVITCFRDGEVTLRSNRREEGFTVSLQETGYQGIEKGDLVVHGMDGFAGSIGISDSRGKATPVLNVLDSNEDKKYLMYYMRSAAFCGLFLSLATGIRIRTCDTNWNKLKNVLYLVPPLPEQQAISAYLDRQCAHIDNIIEKTKASIEEYKKLRQAVITQAVTKGVRGDRPMKDSGIDYLRSIPLDWSIISISKAFSFLGGYAYKSDRFCEETKNQVIRIGNVKDDNLLLNTKAVYIDDDYAEESKSCIIKEDDILFSMTGTKGKKDYFYTVLVTKEMLQEKNLFLNQRVGCFRKKAIVHMKYYCYLLKCHIIKDYVLLFETGTANQGNIGIETINRTKLYYPSYEEQQEIAEYLDKKCAEIDSLISKKEQFLTELESYKKSMIYEYVTGKKEVPQA